MTPKRTHDYSSYLLRIWRAAEGKTPSYRAYLEDLTTSKRVGFANLESLFAFLEAASAVPQRKEDDDVKTETGE